MSESRKKEDEVRQEDSVSNYDDCYVNSVLSMTSGCKHVCDCLRHHHNSSPYEINFRYGISIILESGDYNCCTKKYMYRWIQKHSSEQSFSSSWCTSDWCSSSSVFLRI